LYSASKSSYFQKIVFHAGAILVHGSASQEGFAMQKPRWSLRLLAVVGLAMLTCILLSANGRADDGDAKDKKKGKGKGPEIVEIDLNKLPPALARELRERLQTPATEPKKDKKDKKGVGKKGKDKTINLIEAIRIAESAGVGEAVKAERKSKDGVTQFKVELRSSSGEKTKLALDERGKRLEPDPKDTKKGKGKGKAKE
jgi:hypothetical protein